jgi:hypothetical protein
MVNIDVSVLENWECIIRIQLLEGEHLPAENYPHSQNNPFKLSRTLDSHYIFNESPTDLPTASLYHCEHPSLHTSQAPN